MKVSNLLKNYDFLVQALHLNSEELELSQISSEKEPQKNSLVFISRPESVERAMKAEVGALVVPESHKEQAKQIKGMNILTSPNPRLAMAIILKEAFSNDRLKQNLQESHDRSLSFIHPSAKIHDSVWIGPFCNIGANVKIEEDVLIGSNTVIQAETEIGKNSKIHEQVYLGQNTKIGQNCEIFPLAGIGTEGFGYASSPKDGMHYPIPHQGRVVLDDFVHIGSGTKIDRGTFGESRIGQHSKIDNNCHLAHNSVIGKSALIAAGFSMAGSTTIGDFFVSGGNVSVTGHITVCDHVQVAGLSGVHKSITEPGSYAGYPLEDFKSSFKNKASYLKLHKMRKDLKNIMTQLKLKSS